jgi:hypothetical protein
MSKTGRANYRRGARGIPQARQPRHITVRGVRRDQPDLRKLARAVIAEALAEAEALTQATSPSSPTDDETRGAAHD